jgi:hypothetical protein
VLFAAALLAPTATSGVAAAQEANAADTAAARALAVEGLKLADAGNCADAIDKLARAEKLHHGPIVLSRLGECSINQGKLVDGTEMLRRVLREALPPNPTPALLKARERAQSALDAAKPKIATLTISVKGPPENALVVTVDGQSVSSALLDAGRPTDPGEHVVDATAPGYLKASKRVTVGAGEKQSVALEIQPDPQAAAQAAAPPPSGGSAFSNREPAGRTSATPGADLGTPRSVAPNRAPAYVAWAVGGAALIVGGGFGAIAMKGKSDLDKQCTGTVCPATAQGRLDSATMAGTISTIAVVVGGIGLTLGTVLYVTASPTTASMADRSLARREPAMRARAFVGLGQLGLAGDF